MSFRVSRTALSDFAGVTMALDIPEFLVEPASFSHNHTEIRQLRALYLAPLHDPNSSSEDDDLADQNAFHAVARRSFNDATPIGAIRLSLEGEVSQLLVAPEFRRQGVARALLQWAVDLARSRGLARVYAYPERTWIGAAQAPSVLAWLNACGFVSVPERPQRFQMSFHASEPIARRVDQQARQSQQRGSQPIGGKTREALAHALLQVLAGAKREFWLYSRDLDPSITDRNEFLEPLRMACLRPGMRVHILVQDPSRAVMNGHRLIELSRRLPSVIEFRCPQAEDLQFIGAFATNDDFGFVERSFGDRFECEGDRYHIAECSRLRRYFADVWERARPTSEFRRLSL